MTNFHEFSTCEDLVTAVVCPLEVERLSKLVLSDTLRTATQRRWNATAMMLQGRGATRKACPFISSPGDVHIIWWLAYDGCIVADGCEMLWASRASMPSWLPGVCQMHTVQPRTHCFVWVEGLEDLRSGITVPPLRDLVQHLAHQTIKFHCGNERSLKSLWLVQHAEFVRHPVGWRTDQRDPAGRMPREASHPVEETSCDQGEKWRGSPHFAFAHGFWLKTDKQSPSPVHRKQIIATRSFHF